MSKTSNTSLNHQLSQYVFRSILSTVGASIYVLADSFFCCSKNGRFRRCRNESFNAAI